MHTIEKKRVFLMQRQAWRGEAESRAPFSAHPTQFSRPVPVSRGEAEAQVNHLFWPAIVIFPHYTLDFTLLGASRLDSAQIHATASVARRSRVTRTSFGPPHPLSATSACEPRRSRGSLIPTALARHRHFGP